MRHLGTESSPLRVAIVGSGPSGFYAADALLRSDLVVRVDLFEKLPVPYGLVRYGVAPDALNTKRISAAFEHTAGHERFRFLGNVEVGRDIAVAELRRFYDAVILAYGAAEHRRLGISGEDLPGSHSASEFTGWYNGHPEFSERTFDLSHPVAVVVGNGNVAMDVARILGKTPAELQHSDMPEYARRALADSRIREIQLLGRRGPAQAAFTHLELDELQHLADCAPMVDPQDMPLNEASRVELEHAENHKHKHNYDMLQKLPPNRDPARSRRLGIRFYCLPVEISGDGRVEKLKVERGVLIGEPGAQKVKGTGRYEDIECGLVIRCIGYHSVPLSGVPFDRERGVIPNEEGRVVDGNRVVPGLYVAGWVKHGPVGLIGTSRRESKHVVQALAEDLPHLTMAEARAPDAVLDELHRRGIKPVSFQDWLKIDAAEKAIGAKLGKPREKFCTMNALLKAANVPP